MRSQDKVALSVEQRERGAALHHEARCDARQLEPVLLDEGFMEVKCEDALGKLETPSRRP